MNARPEPIRGWHHFYFGLLLVLGGFYLIWVNVWLAGIVALIGAIIMADDFIQHTIQQSNPAYHSPLRRFYSKYLYPIPLVKKITELFDRIFGK